MADVFISYSSVEREDAHRLVAVLEQHGLTVWWDQHLQGEALNKEIPAQIARAAAVVALLSWQSVNSPEVAGEIVLAGEKLVPARIDDIPIKQLPTRVIATHVIDLRDWRGESGHEGLQKIVSRCFTLKTGQPPAQANRVRPEAMPPPPGEPIITSTINIGRLVSHKTFIGTNAPPKPQRRTRG
jgi:hypothetical protein